MDKDHLYTITEKLGEGSYGKVYKGVNSTKEVAVKVMEADNKGIQSLLEISIMTTYKHDFLNRCFNIVAENQCTKLYQDLAISDLSKASRKKLPDDETLRIWCHSIAQAIACLHKENIIHCDIKASNILIYNDGHIRLSDFNLSILKLETKDTFLHTVCTLPYRPPEILLKEKWSTPIDIWSFGCTIYEIAIGKLLIPIQAKEIISDQKKRLEARKKTLDCIISWRKELGDNINPKYNINRNFIKVSLDDKWKNIPVALKHMVIDMTSFDPYLRPDITKILENNYFNGLKRKHLITKSSDPGKITNEDIKLIEKLTEKSTSYNFIIKKAKEIFSRCSILPSIDYIAKIETCIWISTKLITGNIQKKTLTPLYEIIESERIICEYLKFSVHKFCENSLYISS